MAKDEVHNLEPWFFRCLLVAIAMHVMGALAGAYFAIEVSPASPTETTVGVRLVTIPLSVSGPRAHPINPRGPKVAPAAAGAPLPASSASVESDGAVEDVASVGDGEATTAGVAVYGETEVDSAATLADDLRPSYPELARRQGLEATLRYEITVDEWGAVVEWRSLGRKGFGFDESAELLLPRLKFKPALRRGVAVRSRLVWVCRFRLE